MEENKEIKKANDEYEYLTGEEAERRIAFLRDKAIRDEKSIRYGGREEEREKIAKRLLDIKMPIEQIVEATGLTREKIEELKKK